MARLTFLSGGSVWLKHWSEANGKSGGNYNVGKYIGIYFALGLGSSTLVLIQMLLLWIFCSVEVSDLQCTVLKGLLA
jgi:ATP-binding cassette subfamily C (CFTR/MRP) protein 1